jgi:hypothetical protein
MRVFLVIGLAILWLIGSMISLTLEQTYIGQEAQFDNSGNQIGTVSTLDQLMSPQFAQITNPVTFVVGIFNIVWDYLKALWNMLWWNYAMFTGVWSIFKYVGWCISLGVVVSLVLAIRGTGSS